MDHLVIGTIAGLGAGLLTARAADLRELGCLVDIAFGLAGALVGAVAGIGTGSRGAPIIALIAFAVALLATAMLVGLIKLNTTEPPGGPHTGSWPPVGGRG